jgi:hypothetical protein
MYISLYAFFWVIPQCLSMVCQRFGTLFSIFIDWGQSANSIRVFRLQKRIIRIMMGCKNRDSCRKSFICLKILPLPSQYIFCLLLFVVKNRELFSTNNELHSFGTSNTKIYINLLPT